MDSGPLKMTHPRFWEYTPTSRLLNFNCLSWIKIWFRENSAKRHSPWQTHNAAFSDDLSKGNEGCNFSLVDLIIFQTWIMIWSRAIINNSRYSCMLYAYFVRFNFPTDHALMSRHLLRLKNHSGFEIHTFPN